MIKYVLLALVLTLTIAATACASAPTPVPTVPPPTAVPSPAEANKALVRRYLDTVLIGGNLDAIDGFVTPAYKRYVSATAAPLNAAGQKQRLAGIRAAFPDMQVTIEDMIAEGDRVAYRMTIRGTYKAPFAGIPATNKAATDAVLETVRIENGKIAEHWGGPDIFNVLMDLGVTCSIPPAK